MTARRDFWTLLVAVLLLATLGGCASAPERELSRQHVPYASLPNGHDPLNPERYMVIDAAKASAAEGVIPGLERLRGHALNILELSGGGQYGAFGAGFLKGWTESGQRPEFDVVTGVSTGALLATHAFLGTPGDDAVLEEIFTTITSRDIYTDNRRLLSLLFGANAILDTSPLQALLDKYITAEVLQRVAAAYDANRRLWVGTTNLDYGQTWVWNLGMIAKEGTPEALALYKQVLRASAAPPIAFPPVEIAGYLFADGGVRQNLVVVGLAGTEKPKPPKYGPGCVFRAHSATHSRAIRPLIPPPFGHLRRAGGDARHRSLRSAALPERKGSRWSVCPCVRFERYCACGSRSGCPPGRSPPACRSPAAVWVSTNGVSPPRT